MQATKRTSFLREKSFEIPVIFKAIQDSLLSLFSPRARAVHLVQIPSSVCFEIKMHNPGGHIRGEEIWSGTIQQNRENCLGESLFHFH